MRNHYILEKEEMCVSIGTEQWCMLLQLWFLLKIHLLHILA